MIRVAVHVVLPKHSLLCYFLLVSLSSHFRLCSASPTGILQSCIEILQAGTFWRFGALLRAHPRRYVGTSVRRYMRTWVLAVHEYLDTYRLAPGTPALPSFPAPSTPVVTYKVDTLAKGPGPWDPPSHSLPILLPCCSDRTTYLYPRGRPSRNAL